LDLLQIKGVGEKTLEKLKNQKIMSIEDMLFHFPKRYEINFLDNINYRKLNTNLILKVKVNSEPKVTYIRKKLTKMSFYVETEGIKFSVSIFNREFLRNIIKRKNILVVFGKFIKNFSSFTASNIKLNDSFKEGIFPQYGYVDIPDSRIIKIIKNILDMSYFIEEKLPQFIINKRNFEHINVSLKKIHFPADLHEVESVKQRLAYEEFLMFALRVQLIKKISSRILTAKKRYDIIKVRDFINTIPFELTGDQKNATNDIFKDLKSEKRMNRLLQGDVGSGKTIVSIISAFAVVTSGYQVAVLAPTLVLAIQHFNTFKKYLDPFNVSITLLTSDSTAKERYDILKDIETGDIQIIIGTHSLLHEDIHFNSLGYVIIDEQQRFGVNQRRILREKGNNPDLLLMTATPIPRTLAISYYESHDISVIRQKPNNRKDIKSMLIEFSNLEKAFKIIENEIKNYRQVYVICPLIKESNSSCSISVEEAYKIIINRFKMAKTDILHGKMNDKEKNEVLSSFYKNETQILVSTTVVEVGVNVANATSMIIFNANNFGLAQLHQLRGRIGRNDLESYCFFIVDDLADENDRLGILEKTNDGFIISEHDLSLRGPGEVFGSSQSGLPELVYGNIVKDKVMLDVAFHDADEVISSKEKKSQMLVKQILKSIESYNFD
jgi:ATP-dependent DNA helicase RecG